MVSCPLCFESFPSSVLEAHASNCQGKISKVPTTPVTKTLKRQSDQDDSPFPNKKSKSFPDTSPREERKISDKSSSNFARDSNVPLADRMRPKELTDYLGQEAIESGLWRDLIEGDKIPSLILWGPPGCGKTSLAHVIAQRCRAQNIRRFVKLSAVTSGVADVKEVVKQAKNELKLFKRRTILFIDEVHRFNKLQQDAFLPHVEDGTITLIGATTENPSFSLNSALLSRCKVIPLTKLAPEIVETILAKAVESENGSCDPEALTYLANMADGDARMALNCLQMALNAKGKENITMDIIKESLRRSHVLYDRKGDEHYHCASALQKSIRGSDENAALYWCMRMLQGGEDPLFIARRLVRISSEDVGLADPTALTMAVSTMQGCQLIGKPECNILLAECCTYLARAKKSHEVYGAMENVLAHLDRAQGNLPGVPIHLRNATNSLAKSMGYGKGYSYNLEDVGKIQYLPDEVKENFFKKP